jgi:sec-independent protein translocase protein TatA
MPNIGPMELIVVLVIALMVLGPKKLPEVGRSVGKGLREFKDSVSGNHDDEPQTLTAAAPPVATPAPNTEVHTSA